VPETTHDDVQHPAVAALKLPRWILLCLLAPLDCLNLRPVRREDERRAPAHAARRNLDFRDVAQIVDDLAQALHAQILVHHLAALELLRDLDLVPGHRLVVALAGLLRLLRRAPEVGCWTALPVASRAWIAGESW